MMFLDNRLTRSTLLLCTLFSLVFCNEPLTAPAIVNRCSLPDLDGGDDHRTDAGVSPQLRGDPCAGESTPWECSPIDMQGCDDGSDIDAGSTMSCAWGRQNNLFGFYCFSNATEPEGAACEDIEGPWCGPGLTCKYPVGETAQQGVCVKMCCAQSDCESGETCTPVGEDDHPSFINITGGAFGYCE